MNRLPTPKQALILSHFVEGLSVRSIERITGVHRDTIIRLLLSTGEIARDVLDTQMMNLDIKRLQVDGVLLSLKKFKTRTLPAAGQYRAAGNARNGLVSRMRREMIIRLRLTRDILPPLKLHPHGP